MMHIKKITLEQILPCLADPSKIRFVAAIDRDVSEFLPYLNAVLKGAIYNHGSAYLTGMVRSSDFPTGNPYQAARNGECDAFVAGWTDGNLFPLVNPYPSHFGGGSSSLGDAFYANLGANGEW
jgi:hypothetical protein